jgi:hypothetical protein
VPAAPPEFRAFPGRAGMRGGLLVDTFVDQWTTVSNRQRPQQLDEKIAGAEREMTLAPISWPAFFRPGRLLRG